MSAVLTDYTTYDEIRGALGVSAKEIPDTVLAQAQFLTAVEEYMKGQNSTLLTYYTTAKTAVTGGSPTALQQQFYSLFRMTAMMVVAKQIADGAIEMFSFQALTDGKASWNRVDDPFSQLRIDLAAGLNVWTQRLADCLFRTDAAQTVIFVKRTYATGAGLPSDPVLGV